MKNRTIEWYDGGKIGNNNFKRNNATISNEYSTSFYTDNFMTRAMETET